VKYEKVQKKNPHRVSVNQHIIPIKCIERFTSGNVVELRDLKRGITRNASPNDEVFICKRMWDHASETGFMKSVEDSFQDLVDKLVEGHSVSVEERNKVVTEFYSLWCARFFISKHANNENVFLPVTGDVLTKDEEEKIESMNMAFVRSGGVMPERFINGGQAQLRYMSYKQVYENTNWGLVTAKKKEFIVPDNFLKVMVVPISPKLSFIGGCRDGVASNFDVLKVNRAAVKNADSFIFAHKFSMSE
jgi:hypothetical protein